MPELIRVDLAVNDRVGRRTRRVEAVTIAGNDLINVGDLMELEVSLPFSINTVEGRLTIAKRRFTFQGHRSHVGSVMFDSVQMRPSDVAELVNHLRENGATLLAAEETLCHKYERHHRFAERDLLNVIGD